MSYVGLDIDKCSELKAHLDQAAADLDAHASTVEALLAQADIHSCRAPAEIRDRSRRRSQTVCARPGRYGSAGKAGYSATNCPEPPSSVGKSRCLGRPSFIRRTVFW